jgi:hypothetical protein
MKNEDIVVIAQLLTAMKDAVERLEKYTDKKNIDKANEVKKEILNIQEEIEGLL